MSRKALETLGPDGRSAVRGSGVALYGPKPVHEGQAIVDTGTKF